MTLNETMMQAQQNTIRDFGKSIGGETTRVIIHMSTKRLPILEEFKATLAGKST